MIIGNTNIICAYLHHLINIPKTEFLDLILERMTKTAPEWINIDGMFMA